MVIIPHPLENFYNSHGKYKPELNEYFQMYRCQLNFAMFCPKVHLVFCGNTSKHQQLTCARCL